VHFTEKMSEMKPTKVMPGLQDYDACHELAPSTNFLTFLISFNYLNLFYH